MNSLELAFRVARLRFFERRVLINDIKKASESVALATTLLAVANMRVARGSLIRAHVNTVHSS